MELTGKAVEAGINYFEFRYREADFFLLSERTDVQSGYSGRLAVCKKEIPLHRYSSLQFLKN